MVNTIATAAPSTGWSPDRERFAVLDSWRGIAALIVAWGHIEGSAWFLDNAYHARSGLAVDFFFVLSGFVITAGYGQRLSEGFSVARFMFLRFFRLWPLHIAVVAMFLALELVFLAVGEFGFLQGREPFGQGRELSTLLPTALMLQVYFFPGEHPWSTASWSISVEIGLYLLGALIFVVAGRRAWMAGLTLAVLAAAVLFMRLGGEWSDILRGLLGFGLGMAFYKLWTKVRGWQPGFWLATALETALVVVVLGLIPFIPWRAITVAGFGAIILIFAYERGAISRLLSARGFLWLGALSYSIYLMHGMVIGRAFDVLGLVQGQAGLRLVRSGLGGADSIIAGDLISLSLVAAMLGGAVVASIVTWRFIEEPARLWSKRKAASWGAH